MSNTDQYWNKIRAGTCGKAVFSLANTERRASASRPGTAATATSATRSPPPRPPPSPPSSPRPGPRAPPHLRVVYCDLSAVGGALLARGVFAVFDVETLLVVYAVPTHGNGFVFFLRLAIGVLVGHRFHRERLRLVFIVLVLAVLNQQDHDQPDHYNHQQNGYDH